MRNTLAIARRELSGLFFSPIAYVVIALFALLAGVFFMAFVFRANAAAELRPLFTAVVWMLIPITPAISMRLMSEELKSGTIEPLMTAPVGDSSVILGKWLGAMGFFAVLLLPTAAYVVVLELWADPDYGPIVSGYVGLMLVGGLYLAIGTLASVLTRNQIIAFVVTVFTILVFTVVTTFLPRFIGAAREPLIGEATHARWIVLGALMAAALVVGLIIGAATRSSLGAMVCAAGLAIVLAGVWAAIALVDAAGLTDTVVYLNVNQHYDDFAKGLIDLTDLVFFVSGIALFLVLAVKALESRKWR